MEKISNFPIFTCRMDIKDLLMHFTKMSDRCVQIYVFILKVLTNEKRGGLTMLSFDRSPFKGIHQ
jgi:hypothetical protein